ncbi:YkvA family protein [Pontibacillus litoralis]|uniref:Membrane protein n=1 Tax=Pontibacillus litoralis JSM 072002 TaxID=1385512 RepID=A0A0A5G3I4_9BACI|nr:DUF1232 domain-containing protein [Pontibacillus litoralis]KGX86589.1 membrane protein [Pontibacillus litoralis JSM 072002]
MRKVWKRLRFVFNVRKSIPFLFAFFRSYEVGRSKKWLAAFFLFGYFVLPFDAIPDIFGVIGLIDDIAVFTFVLQRIVKMAPPSLRKLFNVDDDLYR